MSQKSGEQMRLEGLGKTAAKHAVELYAVQLTAKELGRKLETVGADDVRQFIEMAGRTWTLDNAAGLIFPKKDWIYAGHQKSTNPTARGRQIIRWRLKNGHHS